MQFRFDHNRTFKGITRGVREILSFIIDVNKYYLIKAITSMRYYLLTSDLLSARAYSEQDKAIASLVAKPQAGYCKRTLNFFFRVGVFFVPGSGKARELNQQALINNRLVFVTQRAKNFVHIGVVFTVIKVGSYF